MGDIGDDLRPGLVRDLSDFRAWIEARIRARAHHDHLGLVFPGELRQLIEIEPFVLAAHPVGNGQIELAREVQRVAVREVSPLIERHAEEDVARFQERLVGHHVGLGTAVRLDVRKPGTEEFLGPVAGQPFRLVDVDAASVVAPAGIPLGVLVRHDRTGGFHDRIAREVLGRDQFETLGLADLFGMDRGGDFGIPLGETGTQVAAGKRLAHGNASIGPPRWLRTG